MEHWEEAKKHGDKAKQVSNQEVARRMEQVEQLTGTTQKKEETYQTEETQKKERVPTKNVSQEQTTQRSSAKQS